MKKYTLYIGSDNETKIISLKFALDIISEYFNGFTYSQVKGYWNAEQEDTLKVEIATQEPKEKILALCAELKKHLKQESIMIDNAGIVDFV